MTEWKAGLLLAACLAPPTNACAQDGRVVRLPYAFWNENFGAAVGYAYAVQGAPQAQASLLGTVMAGENGSVMGFAMGQDLLLFGSERLFVDPIVSIGRFADLEAYVDGNPEFPDQRAGSHESDPQDFIQGRGDDLFVRLRFKYLLPTRHGRAFVELRPFYRSQDIRTDASKAVQNTNGIEAGVLVDHRDDPVDPTRGHALGIDLTRDFGSGDSSASWTNVAAEYDHYVPLRAMRGFRQGVLAFDAWASWSPTWEVLPDGNIAHRPPAFSGATLGGLFRMRAFPSQRYSDKAAVYLGTELRMMPEWNPFDGSAWLQERLGVEWIQLVGFAEAGRVAPAFHALDEDLRWDAGLGLRLSAKGMVGRLDVAWSDEGLGVQMMVGQPFRF